MPCGWGVKAGMVHVWDCGWQVKLCDPLVTYGPYLSISLEIRLGIIKRYTNGSFTLLFTLKLSIPLDRY